MNYEQLYILKFLTKQNLNTTIFIPTSGFNFANNNGIIRVLDFNKIVYTCIYFAESMFCTLQRFFGGEVSSFYEHIPLNKLYGIGITEVNSCNPRRSHGGITRQI